MVSICPLCGEPGLHALPLPHPAQAMISDGRIFPAPLAKSHCLACGMVLHTQPLSAAEVRQFYDAAYDLGAETGQADATRNQNYADQILAWAGPGPFGRVLEVGCGSGQTLQALAQAWPETGFMGLEAAIQLAKPSENSRIAFQHGFAEDLPPPATPFDLIFSINVIEHSADPAAFLSALAAQLAPGGQILLICPTAVPANLEVLFLDHVHSFSQAGLQRLATSAGLKFMKAAAEPEGLAGFQVFLLTQGEAKLNDLAQSAGDHKAYLTAWQSLDDTLLEEIGPDQTLDLFGAGEMAALLRCYAPSIWERIGRILVDATEGARNLGKPVIKLSDIDNPADATLIATHPRAQNVFAARLQDAGHRPIVFNHLIPR
ncbi:MAG: class I SAM-dependent methyltransferase [Pseudomonadota bacterium]